jgi:hypothetical protein
VTLGRLVLAWAPVALWFIAVAWFVEQWAERGSEGLARRLVRVSGEALVTTLLASLWFDSLGHGGWWLLFLLLGVLAGFPTRWRDAESGASSTRRAVALGLIDAARYVAAGALLALRLG